MKHSPDRSIKHNKRRSKGSVTPAFALILAAVCLLNAVFADYAIYRAGLYHYKKRTEMALGSIMASFDSLLSDYYGIYGVNIMHYTDYENDFRRYADVFRDKGRIRLLDWNLKEYEISFSDSLAEPDALKKQISASMKYMTAANALDFLLDCLLDIDGAEDMSKAAGILAEGNELLFEADGMISDLSLYLEGAFPGDRACANGYRQAVTDFSLISSAVNDFDLSSLEKEDVCDTFYLEHMHLKSLLSDYLNYNLKAQNEITKLQKIKQKIDAFIAQAEESVKSIEDESCRECLKAMTDSLKKQAALISNLRYYSKINENVASLNGKISGINHNISLIDAFRSDSSELPDVRLMAENIRKTFYTDDVFTSFDVSGLQRAVDVEGPYTDYRYLPFEFEGIYGRDSYAIPGNIYPMLPSAVKGIKPDTTGFSVNFSDFSGLKDILNAGSFLDGVKAAGEAALEHLFVDEYVYYYFTDRITAPDSASFKCQKEYILCGNQNASDNIKAASNKLLLLRFVLNFASVMMNEEKVTLARETGAAIACAVSAGIGTELYAILIMAAWAMADSIADVGKLVNGEKVPILKREDTADSSEGLDYTGYIMLLILSEDTETVLLRIADVIEIEMSDRTGERYKLSGVYTKISGRTVYEPFFLTDALFGKKKGEISVEFKGEETV